MSAHVKLVAAGAAALMLDSCGAPEYALYPGLEQRKAALGTIEVVSVASFRPESSRGMDPALSAATAGVVRRRAVAALQAKGYRALDDSAGAGTFLDRETLYPVGMGSVGELSAYLPEFVQPGPSSISGDTALALPERAAALRLLLAALRLPQDSGMLPDDSLAQALAFHRATGVEHVLVVETFVRTVSRRRRVIEAVVTGVLTFGQWAWWERPLGLVNVYLIDCRSGTVLWYDGAMTDETLDPDGAGSMAAKMLARMP
jgi:hypothetical protein